jgi:F-type H+-transporting ATPase subunit delta
MQAASREALAGARQRLDERIADTSVAGVRDLSGELFDITGVLVRERALRRLLADPATAEADRTRLADTVFGGKVSDATLATLTGLVTARWSQPGDLVDATETLARRAQLSVAEQDGSLEDVEDELFRFARSFESNDELRGSLTDELIPAGRRQAIVEDLLGERATPTTVQLISMVVGSGRARDLPAIVDRLVERAAQAKRLAVAEVRVAVPLTDDQQDRLKAAIANATDKDVTLKVVVDPSVIGGLVATVGDVVIDGTVRTRLDQLKSRL